MDHVSRNKNYFRYKILKMGSLESFTWPLHESLNHILVCDVSPGLLFSTFLRWGALGNYSAHHRTTARTFPTE